MAGPPTDELPPPPAGMEAKHPLIDPIKGPLGFLGPSGPIAKASYKLPIVGDLFQQMGDLAMKLPSGMMGGGAGGGAGAAGKAGGPAMAITAAIGAVVKILETGFEMLQKFFKILVEASPRLGATMKLLWRGIMLFLRPLGDLIGMALRPLARWLIRLNRAAMQAGRAAGRPGTVEYQKAYQAEWFKGFIDGMGEYLIKPLFEMISTTLPAIIEQLGPVLLVLITVAAPTILLAIVKGLATVLTDLGGWIWKAMTDLFNYITAIITDAVWNMANKLTKGLVGYTGTRAVDAYLASKTSKTSRASMGDANVLKSGVTTDPEVLYYDPYGPVYKGQNQSQRYAKGGIATQATAGIFGESGREALIPLDKLKGGNSNTVNLTWHQNAPIYGITDLERSVNKILDGYFKTKVMAR
jgi:hypothetical protein